MSAEPFPHSIQLLIYKREEDGESGIMLPCQQKLLTGREGNSLPTLPVKRLCIENALFEMRRK